MAERAPHHRPVAVVPTTPFIRIRPARQPTSLDTLPLAFWHWALVMDSKPTQDAIRARFNVSAGTAARWLSAWRAASVADLLAQAEAYRTHAQALDKAAQLLTVIAADRRMSR
jgi:hypothetical protein